MEQEIPKRLTYEMDKLLENGYEASITIDNLKKYSWIITVKIMISDSIVNLIFNIPNKYPFAPPSIKLQSEILILDEVEKFFNSNFKYKWRPDTIMVNIIKNIIEKYNLDKTRETLTLVTRDMI